jgi:ferredoxin-NADP reductase
MLTEPLTTPPTKKLQAIYGIIVGILFSPQLQFAGFYTTPEMALLAGNVFSFIVSPKYKLMLKLKNKFQETDNICNFYFPRPKNFVFVPGQYMEWTLPNVKFDSRGNRRYFTIASSPTEDVVQLGVRFENDGSQFKKSLDSLTDKTPIIGTGLSGDFTLPSDKTKKLVFIAGGIGVTPYRSIIKYLIDKNERRDIVLFYSNKTESEIVYKDVFSDAVKKLGIKVIYVLTGEKTTKSGFESGRITEGILKKTMSDYNERIYYISGPQAMVDNYKSLLKDLQIPDRQIITDYFPGFA